MRGLEGSGQPRHLIASLLVTPSSHTLPCEVNRVCSALAAVLVYEVMSGLFTDTSQGCKVARDESRVCRSAHSGRRRQTCVELVGYAYGPAVRWGSVRGCKVQEEYLRRLAKMKPRRTRQGKGKESWRIFTRMVIVLSLLACHSRLLSTWLFMINRKGGRGIEKWADNRVSALLAAIGSNHSGREGIVTNACRRGIHPCIHEKVARMHV